MDKMSKTIFGIRLAHRRFGEKRDMATMWNWFNCYLSGRHEFGVSCEPGTIFLRCTHCGRRSSGWAIDPKLPHAPVVAPAKRTAKAKIASASPTRVLPFGRVAAS
jgi:hypothetical protein